MFGPLPCQVPCSGRQHRPSKKERSESCQAICFPLLLSGTHNSETHFHSLHPLTAQTARSGTHSRRDDEMGYRMTGRQGRSWDGHLSPQCHSRNVMQNQATDKSLCGAIRVQKKSGPVTSEGGAIPKMLLRTMEHVAFKCVH